MPPTKKLKTMIDDLRDMKREMLPTKDKDGNLIDTMDPNLDDFQRKTLQLTQLLEEMRPDIERGAKLRASADPSDREQRINIIRVTADNTNSLRKAGELWKEAQQLVVLAQQRRKLDEKTLENRKDALKLLFEEIKELSSKNSSEHSHKSEEEKTIERKKAERDRRKKTGTGSGAGAAAGGGKRDRRRPGAATAASAGGDDDIESGGGGMTGSGGSTGASTGGGGGGGGGGDDGIEMRPVAPASAEESQFQAEVQQNRQQQDKMLEEILSGVNELGDLAGALSTEIKVQGVLIDEVDTKIANTTTALKSSTAKLQELLEESGGACKIVPYLILGILLLGLIGYLYHMTSS